MRRNGTLLLATLTALGVPAVSASSASAAKHALTLKTAHGALASSAPIVMSSSEVLWQTPAFKITCSEGKLEGTLGSNAASKDTVSFASALFTGGEPEEACKTSNAGPAVFSTSNLPWKLELSYKGTARIKASGKVVWSITLPSKASTKCSFEAKGVEGVIPTTGPATIHWSDAVFTKPKKGDPSLCPSEASLSTTWQLSSGGEAVEVEV